MDKAIAASPNGVEGLDLPSHLVSLKDGQLDLTAIATPVKQQVAELGRDADVSGVAAGLGLRWPDQTPLQMLSVPVTTSHCCTASISLLSELLQDCLARRKESLASPECLCTHVQRDPGDANSLLLLFVATASQFRHGLCMGKLRQSRSYGLIAIFAYLRLLPLWHTAAPKE